MSIDYVHNARVLKHLRIWCDENLPVYGSYIGYDLAVQILESSACEYHSCLKDIYHSLPHSEPQLRRKLRAFETDGWVRIIKSRQDHRNCLVSPTEKMLWTYEQYFLLMAKLGKNIKLS
jgi:hypothetical protein